MSTIDVGIDLGTTNSAIAVLRGVTTEVIGNNEGDQTTPSAVWADRRGRLHVGRAARERGETDPDNTCLEFKLRMGTVGTVKTLAGQDMTPERLSAEVLRSLRADASARLGEELRAAVITVPAAFDLSACDATRRAAELAGLRVSPLLPEPAAAAHCYGFQNADEDATWLVYDLGGGTFDAAVIRLRDGEFSVARHAGDNFLGGKVVDWRIVDEVLIPAAVARHRGLAGLSRGNPRWASAVAALKSAAEHAKIRLSRMDSTDVLVELVGDDRDRYEVDVELRRADVERLAEPVVAKSVNLCRDALAGIGIGPADLTKVIMVGGQTAMPYLRERVAAELGIPLDFDQDPMTVVARGAAIFAGAQPLDLDPVAPPPGTFRVELAYPRVGPDADPVVTGRVAGPGTLPELSVELVDEESDPAWRSGRIRLSDRGHFSTTLWATRGRRHTYRIELTDATGTVLPVTPDHLTYTVGGVEAGQSLGTSIGVGLDGNRMLPMVERGTPLPARRVLTLRTTVGVRRGEGGGMIRIPVLEGDHARGDRNRRIGRLEVLATQVGRTVPAGSEVRLTVEVDTSRLVHATVDVPLLDEVFDHTINLNTETAPAHRDLATEAEAELARLATVRERQRSAQSPLAGLHLSRIDEENLPAEVERLVVAAAASEDEALAAAKRVIDLRVATDAVEDELRWPELVRDAESITTEARGLVETNGSQHDRDSLPAYERGVGEAIESRDADLLRQRIDELRRHVARVLDRGPLLQLMIFQQLAERRGEMRSPALADRLLAEGREAVDTGQHDRLRTINPQLADQLPADVPTGEVFSTVSLFQ
ncbi:MAG TPA: Hsp70 family protein [Actinophytocola sp.]|nr:Hsp70 family protein [Actinophytocola sp.]